MKPIHTASPRILRLLMRMSRYNVKLKCIQGKTNVITDVLSRMTLNNSNSSTHHNDTISVEEVLCSNVQISTTGIQKIRQETSKDVKHLKSISTYGWPETRRECSNYLHMFWNCIYGLSVENYVIRAPSRKTLE